MEIPESGNEIFTRGVDGLCSKELASRIDDLDDHAVVNEYCFTLSRLVDGIDECDVLDCEIHWFARFAAGNNQPHRRCQNHESGELHTVAPIIRVIARDYHRNA